MENNSWEYVGGLSSPSKMPCHAYSISARRCITGRKLAKIAGSVCAGCYALKGNYMFGNVQGALERRFKSLRKAGWVEQMVKTISAHESSGFFRWHDSGDLQGVWHLQKIVSVCAMLPGIRFWLPTRELKIVREYLATGAKFPENLTVRISAFMVDEKAAEGFARENGLTVSEVRTSGASCPSSKQGGKCLSCRACWDKSQFLVSYAKH